MAVTMFKTEVRDYALRWRDDEFITAVECSRATDKSVWIIESHTRGPVERRHDRSSSYRQFHDTWEGAYSFLLEKAEKRHRDALVKLATESQELDAVRALKP